MHETYSDDIAFCVEFPVCVCFPLTDELLGEWGKVPAGDRCAEGCVFTLGLTRCSWCLEV